MSGKIEFSYIVGARKNSKLVYIPSEKQIYMQKTKWFNKALNEELMRYECYVKGCGASIHIGSGCSKYIREEVCSVHSDHPGQEERMMEFALKNSIKREVSECSLKRNQVRAVFNNECERNKDAAQLVSFNKMKRNLRKIKASTMPKAPQSPRDFIELFQKEEIVKKFGMCESDDTQSFYQTTVIEKDFAYTLFFSSPIGNAILQHIELEQRHYLLDATFSVVPQCEYKQLLIMYIGHDNHVFPFAFILMTRKTQKCYEHLFQFMNSNVIQFQAKSFTSDFEKGLRNALQNVFPEARLKGCWFHFCQAIRRKALMLKELGTDDARRILKKIMALPLLPSGDIEEGLNICKQEAYGNVKLCTESGNVFDKFFEYFEKQWIRKELPENLSLSGESVRTTSALEGYNSYLCRRIPTRGNFWDFLRVIKNDEFQKYTELTQALDGTFDIFERPKKRNKTRSDLIEDITQKLNAKRITIAMFLKTMSNKRNDIITEENNVSLYEDSETDDVDGSNTSCNDNTSCEICFKNKKDTILKPCRHGKICRSCFDEICEIHRINKTTVLCPFCRQVVGQTEHFYI